MIGMTMCSGIGAPEIAAPWVDWRFASEIEALPRAVLQERFGYKLPEDHNQGDPLLWSDMTEITPQLLRDFGIPLPDLIVAGTPCQDFSIAGLRAGTAGDRGNLTLKFVELVHAIVDARPDGKLRVLWENVPGVLSDKGNAFGNFLGAIVGGDDPIPQPRSESWPGVGMVAGPLGRAAWATLDAQWFGVAQRRRRVFVVVDFGNACDPAKILFEPKGLCGNPPPSREKGQGVADAARGGASHWGGQDVHPSLNQSHNTGGIGSSNQGVFSQGGAGLVPDQSGFRMTAFGEYADDETASTLKERDHKDATDLVAFDAKGTEVQHDLDVHPPLRSMGHKESSPNAGGHAAIAIQERAVSENLDAGPEGAGFRDDDTAYTLEARQTPQAVAFKPSHYTRDKDGAPSEIYPPLTADADKGDQDPVVAFAQNQLDEVRTMDVAGALAAEPGMKQQTYLSTPAVRRLTPVECARLQGFPDDHTNILVRSKPAADGPQYKAYGNSMAVPVMKWIIDRFKE